MLGASIHWGCGTLPLRQLSGKGIIVTDHRPRLVQVDSRRRVSLGYMIKHDFYSATTESDGTIILTPVMISPVGVTVAVEDGAEADDD